MDLSQEFSLIKDQDWFEPDLALDISAMKTKIILGVILGMAIVGGFTVQIVNLSWRPTPKLTKGVDVSTSYGKVLAVMDRKCQHCHSEGSDLPFYAKLPMAKDLIQKDVAMGLDSFDMVTEFLNYPQPPGVGEVALAKLEWTSAHNEMPPFRYVAMHWNSRLSREEQKNVISWAQNVRKAFYSTAVVSEDYKAHVLQPLPEIQPFEAAKVNLGKQVYNDKRLSIDNSISCATCHDLAKGGTDQEVVSTGVRKQQGPINAPTVFNAGFQVAQFWDGRAKDLQEQASGPVANPKEMGETWIHVVEKLKADTRWAKDFTLVYADGPSEKNITDAIATFEKTLLTRNSAFDRFLMGDEKALDDAQQKGHKIFVERGCANCHVGKVLGGQSFERMGRFCDYVAERGNRTEADNGHFNFTKNEKDRGKFKVPLLRNLEQTFPYFHDGTAKDMNSAVQTMSRCQLEEPLSKQEQDDVVAFLKTLTGSI